ncbi:MAG TPA: GGDEF domain-containing protein [Symbiobacteriaceae bacterium]|nr:GGDEF domain-containing protein [Symbiobacteriaceae bacterium]
MRERWLGALAGIAAAAMCYALARLSTGWFIAAVVLAVLGWLFGGHVRKLRRMAERDELTGVCNRRPFESLLNLEWERATRYRRPLSLLFIDVDDFRTVNKLYGHLMGDEALKVVTRLIRQNIRKTDTLARWGGEEFVVLLPETDVDAAVVLAERIRSVIAQHTIRDNDWAIQVTISTGVSGLPGKARSTRELLRLATAAEAAAKMQKNTVRCVS